MPRPRAGRTAWLLLAAPLLAGCYSFAEPSLKPGDARDVLLDLRLRGIDVTESVSGGSACSDPSLEGNALHLVGRLRGEDEPRDIFLYTFRLKSWDDGEAPVDACQVEYQAANPGRTVTRVDVPVFRALGVDWSPAFEQAVRGALEEASDQGL